MISKTYAPGGTSHSPIAVRPAIRSIRRERLIENAHAVTVNKRDWRTLMWDVVMLALGLGFFAAGIGYAYACERL